MRRTAPKSFRLTFAQSPQKQTQFTRHTLTNEFRPKSLKTITALTRYSTHYCALRTPVFRTLKSEASKASSHFGTSLAKPQTILRATANPAAIALAVGTRRNRSDREAAPFAGHDRSLDREVTVNEDDVSAGNGFAGTIGPPADYAACGYGLSMRRKEGGRKQHRSQQNKRTLEIKANGRLAASPEVVRRAFSKGAPQLSSPGPTSGRSRSRWLRLDADKWCTTCVQYICLKRALETGS